MVDNTASTTNAIEPDIQQSDVQNLHDFYASKADRRAPWYQRLTKRRITYRKIALYALVAGIALLSTPVATTFVAGSALVLLGISLRVWTFGHLAKNKSLITTGPYAHTRNPAYLGSFLIFCGVVIAAGNPYTMQGLIIWGLGLVVAITFFSHYMPRKYKREYTRLRKKFPEEFETHAANVPDFFPRITPWRSGDTHPFSWTSVRANHEFWWPTFLVVGLTVIWLTENVIKFTEAGLILAM